jgi:hypothetical protein
LLEVTPGGAVVAQDDQSWTQPGALVVQHGRDDLALAQLGVAKHQATGSPSGAAGTYSRKPHK